MSVYKDYIGNYYQAIQKYKDSMNEQVIAQNVITVLNFVREADAIPTELLDFRDNSKIFGEETYKYDVFEKAHEALVLDDWDTTLIGSGLICRHVADAMAYTDNLVNRRFAVPEFLNKLKTTDKQKLDKYEMALYEVYLGDDEEKAFRDAVSCFGAKYPLIAFLFFIKDKDRFLPTSPDTFDAIFSEMGIGFKMSQKCSWENYCNFIAIISCVRDYISASGLCDHEVSLLDAHSAVWIMNNEKYKSWHSSANDINTPMKPKDIRIEANDTVKYQCPRCDLLFMKAKRCPECGQFILYDSDSLPKTNKRVLHVGDDISRLRIYEIINKYFGENYSGWMKASYDINDRYWAWFPTITKSSSRPNGSYGGTAMWSNVLSTDRKTVISINHDEINKAPKEPPKKNVLIFGRIDGAFCFLGVFNDYHIPEAEWLTYQHDRLAKGIDLDTFELIDED